MAFHHADTQAAAHSALGRALTAFHAPNDDPSIDSYAGANFLRTRLYNCVAAIQACAAVHQPALAMDRPRGFRL
jgi:hypothetical protein